MHDNNFVILYFESFIIIIIIHFTRCSVFSISLYRDNNTMQNCKINTKLSVVRIDVIEITNKIAYVKFNHIILKLIVHYSFFVIYTLLTHKINE